MESWLGTSGWFILGGVGVAASILLLLCVKPFRRIYREVEFERGRKLFHQRREHLEAKFLQLAAASGKPKGLRWTNCDFHSAHCFGRDRKTAQLTAFVEVTIQFEAIEGGGMEDVAAVGNLRHATALFHFHNGQWGTAGKAIFNLTPTEALAHLSGQIEPVPEGGGGQNTTAERENG